MTTMAYAGANIAAKCRTSLGDALEALQKDPNIPEDVLSVASNIAQAVGALFEAEQASSERDGKASIRRAMGSLSQTMALLQDVRSEHAGIEVTARALAGVMQQLYPLTQAPTVRPVAPEAGALEVSIPKAPRLPSEHAHAPAPRRAPASAATKRERLEANVGATTESNFFVGFSGDVAEGGVFIATYQTLPRGTPVELLVTLPGGFEKTLTGSVRFVRDPMDMDSEPGIGVGFDELERDARELILRFIRKRPPLFYDD